MASVRPRGVSRNRRLQVSPVRRPPPRGVTFSPPRCRPPHPLASDGCLRRLVVFLTGFGRLLLTFCRCTPVIGFSKRIVISNHGESCRNQRSPSRRRTGVRFCVFLKLLDVSGLQFFSARNDIFRHLKSGENTLKQSVLGSHLDYLGFPS